MGGKGIENSGTFPGTLSWKRAGTGNSILKKSGTGGNQELNFHKNRERAGTGNIIFEKIGNGRESGTYFLEKSGTGGNGEHIFFKIGNRAGTGNIFF